MRLILRKGKQKGLIKQFQKENYLTFNEVASLLKIKSGKLKSYFDETSLIPEEIFNKLDKENKFKEAIIDKKEENWGQIKGGLNSNGNTKDIRIPKDSQELAEFYGIMLGDGNLTKIQGYKLGTYMIRIVGDSRYDKEYLTLYVKPLIERLFKINVRIGKFKQENAIFIEAHGIRLVTFLESKGFKPGDKIRNQLRIPIWIRENKTYLKACIRGLIDTDGSIYKLTNQNTHQINFKNFDMPLLIDMREGLLNLGINCSKISKGNSVYITKKEEIAKFFKYIGTKNSRHLNRIKMFKIAP